MVNIFIPKEIGDLETRVAATPETVKRFIKGGAKVIVETGAGEGAYLTDQMYLDAGAVVQDGTPEIWSEADIVLKVAAPGFNTDLKEDEASLLKPGAIIIGFLAPHQNPEMVGTFVERKVSAIPMELIPRITRAQSMDALSSQANVAGYKAVIMAANKLDKYFPQLMTAAGTVRPSKVVIMGAGVAGLQAIATAKRLGAIVEVSDIRPEVKEQIKSLGGKFIEPPTSENGVGKSEDGYAKEVSEDYLLKQQEIIAAKVAEADVVITTALVPGKPAPKLITEEMVSSMRPGSVIVDLAVAQGGNCELSEENRDVTKYGVHILGYSNLPATMAKDASNLYARNIAALLDLIIKEGEINLDMEDEVIKNSMLTHQGSIYHEPTKESMQKEEGIEL